MSGNAQGESAASHGHAMPRDVAESVAPVVRAMADPLRLQIVSALAGAPGGRLAAGDVASLTELAAPTVSHHLRSLREAGVVTAERRGTWIFYSLAPGMDRVASSLLDALARAASAPHPADDVDEPTRLDVDAALSHAVERLVARFPQLSPDVVRLVVRESGTALARTATVTTHLPVLAERFAVQRLEDLLAAAAAEGATSPADGAAPREADGGAAPAPGVPTRPRVLFVCTANAGRSQLAAALLRRLTGDAVVVRSAGSLPAARIHATVEPLLAELLGPEAEEPFPKPLTDDAVRAADVVVTMGCGDATPVLAGKRYEDWPVGDPAMASPDGVRAIHDDLAARVAALAAELLPAAPTGTER
ncbi:ArsR family transcriptional regulator [Actinotalea ferrariae CF5-4]|uniref:ArsR family transcriptional regulator n=1 Tax=Actinotalea ferrariae CF5-4 TaxID=948458 RepID=A0A021VQT2_9CELL|nr:metalloregulator ArsR/SmtB family transcription factor [Actinotalea ferrariae]EYR63483.1 ArsR family transcriptional regulator [Actinotalea ferrariae CF5-4]